ncbi:MAG: hypothetical protein GX101_06315 [Firmicutes bacterium]|nr:hypothetical protein [Bacillota bacterium]NLO66289.1 hypothetical protein [Bacillota bacterium]
MFRKTTVMLLVVALVLLGSTVVLAQEYWAWNQFNTAGEKFKYEIVIRSLQWDYNAGGEYWQETKQYQTIEIKPIDAETSEVTMANTYAIPNDDLDDQLNFMGGMLNISLLTGGGLSFTEFLMLGTFAADLELEVGNSMQTFDGARIRVIEKRNVAGVEGYYFTRSMRETDADGNRVDILTSEWVVAPNVGWPLSVQIYQDGEVVYSMVLVEYERK